MGTFSILCEDLDYFILFDFIIFGWIRKEEENTQLFQDQCFDFLNLKVKLSKLIDIQGNQYYSFGDYSYEKKEKVGN